MNRRTLVWSVLPCALVLSTSACKKKDAPAPVTAAPKPPAAHVAAPASAGPAKQKGALVQAPDAVSRLSKFVPVEFSADLASLTPAEREALGHLRRASDAIDRIFWKQSGRTAMGMRADAQRAGGAVHGLYEIHYGPWDRLDHHKPFLGSTPRPAGAGFYPEDLSKEAIEAYVKANPSEKDALLGAYTVVERRGDKLVAIPYREAYKAELEEAAIALEVAAAKVQNASLAKFLRSRARAFRTDDYFESECDWMDIEGSRIDVTIGPYEVYEDELMGQKTAFEAIIGLRDDVATAALALYRKNLAMLEGALPMPEKYRSRRAEGSPIVVIHKIYAGGDGKKGVNALAFNLPNDEKVRAKKGSKKVMLKNVSQAKFEKILRPIAARILDAAHQNDIDFETFFNHGLMHELSHGMGPGILKGPDGKETTVSQRLKELYSAIEECKADVVGLYSTNLLFDKGILPGAKRRFVYPSYLASMIRSIRFGAAEAHGKANAIQLNFLEKEGAIRFDEMAGRYGVDAAKMAVATRKLAERLLTIEGEGDYEGAKKLIAEYGSLKPALEGALKKLEDIPVDIAPKYPAL
jgi:hypothetical protein